MLFNTTGERLFEHIEDNAPYFCSELQTGSNDYLNQQIELEAGFEPLNFRNNENTSLTCTFPQTEIYLPFENVQQDDVPLLFDNAQTSKSRGVDFGCQMEPYMADNLASDDHHTSMFQSFNHTKPFVEKCQKSTETDSTTKSNGSKSSTELPKTKVSTTDKNIHGSLIMSGSKTQITNVININSPGD